MRLTEARIEVRPRPAWEALDLGILLAREHRGLLMASWALVTLPWLALLSWLLWAYPGVVLVLFWWLKPLYERLPLLILSQALFGEAPSLRQALKAWPATLRRQWLPSLTWRRLSLTRSFTLPVQQLEHLAGDARRRRLGVLCQADMRAARCLTLVGLHLETVLYIGLILGLYVLVPAPLAQGIDWSGAWQDSEQPLWRDHLLNGLYALVLILWEPVYVACGFMLYLNRRIRLEAWDIEGVFKRLRQRLASTTSGLLLGASLILTGLPATGWANSVQDEAGPDSPRLTLQPLSSEQSRRSIEQILQAPPFSNRQTVSNWRVAEPEPADSTALQPPAPSPWLNRLLEAADLIARLLEVLLWGLAIALLSLVLWRYRPWLQRVVAPLRQGKPPARPAAPVVFESPVAAVPVPEDVATHVQALWASQPREALGLLYRALLSRLVRDYHVPISQADTEEQVLAHINSLEHPALRAFSQELTGHWQRLAYGHRLPAAHVQQRLCDSWRELFDSPVQP